MASGQSYITANDEAFRAAIEKASEALRDLRLPFTLISLDFYRSEKAIFLLGSPGQYPDFKGPRGADGKTAYQRRKLEKEGFEYPLLFRSGRLAASMLGPGNRGNVTQISPLTLVMGTTVPYGIYHQSDAQRSKIPLRKFVFIGPEAIRFANSDQAGRLQRWLGYIDDYLEKKLKLQGGK